jgi:hypothetical protein
MSYIEWLSRGPPGCEGATLIFDIGVLCIMGMLGVFLYARTRRS